MLSMLEHALDKAVEEARERALKEIADLDAEKQLQKLIDGAREKLPEGELGEIGESGLKVFEANKANLAEIGVWGVQALTIQLASGDVDAALLNFIRTEASWDDVHAERAADVEATAEDKRERERKKAAVLAFLKELGAVAKDVLPFLLSAVV